MDFSRLDETIAVGYEHASEALRQWQDSGRLAALRESLALPETLRPRPRRRRPRPSAE
jgi:hypothetical protein